MRRGLAALVATAALGVLGACGGERSGEAGDAGGHGPTAVSAALGGHVVARAGGTAIHRDLVAAVARARGLAAADALVVLVDEALLAEAARRDGAGDAVPVKNRTTSALARALTAKIRDAAVARGPWTDDEIEKAMGDDWIELDKPETRVVAHALVRKEVPGAADLAKRLRDELVNATGADAASSEKAFTEKAKAFALPAGHKMIVEHLPPITLDGRIAEPSVADGIEKAFSKETFEIPKALETSKVVESTYGFHVVRLLEIVPPKTTTREEKIAKLGPKLVSVRVGPVFEAELAKLRAAAQPVVLAKDADLVLPP